MAFEFQKMHYFQCLLSFYPACGSRRSTQLLLTPSLCPTIVDYNLQNHEPSEMLFFFFFLQTALVVVFDQSTRNPN